MGIVYRATQVALGRPVALKLIAANFAGDRSFRERFKREWETAASIDHPNVIPVYEAGEAEEHLFIAMRYVEGLDLANLLAREPELAPDRAVRIIAQVASALDAAHARGPRPPRRQARQRPDRGRGARLPHRLRPHQARLPGRPDQDRPVRRQRRLRRPGADPRRGDGRPHRRLLARLRALPDADQAPPVRQARRRGEDVRARLRAARRSSPRPASTARPRFDAVVAKAMAKEPDDRYQSAGELAKAAQAALAGGQPRSTALNTRSAQSRGPIIKGPGASASEQVSRRTKVAIGIALPTILVAGLAAAGLAATRRDRRLRRRASRPRRPPRRRPRTAHGDTTPPPEATVAPHRPAEGRGDDQGRQGARTASRSAAGTCSWPTSRPGRCRSSTPRPTR